MWFEIIPPFLIITAGVGLPGAALWWLHYFTLGNHYRRSLISRWDRRAYQRDLRLTGNPYQVNVIGSVHSDRFLPLNHQIDSKGISGLLKYHSTKP